MTTPLPQETAAEKCNKWSPRAVTLRYTTLPIMTALAPAIQVLLYYGYCNCCQESL